MERSAPLKRKTEMKRGPGPKRKKRRFNQQSRYRPTKAAITRAVKEAKARFREAAKAQRVCAVCGRTDSFDAHHVIEAQYLKQNGHAVYVEANALRVCDQYAKNNCHGKHTGRSRKIRLKELLEENLIYAVELLGPDKAENYLRRNYQGNDPRLDSILEEARGER